MIRRPPRSTQSRSSAASDVYKRQVPRQTNRDHRPSATSRIDQEIPGQRPTSASVMDFTAMIPHKRPATMQCEKPAAKLSRNAEHDVIPTISRAQPGHRVPLNHGTTNFDSTMRPPAGCGEAFTIQDDYANNVMRNKQTKARTSKTTTSRAPRPKPSSKPPAASGETTVRPRTRAGWRAINKEPAVDIHKYVSDRLSLIHISEPTRPY